MTRYHDWQTRLDRFLGLASERDFAFGINDCCIFVADAVQEMTGEDLAKDYRNRYHSNREAIRLIEATTGCKTLRRFLMTALAQLPCIQVEMAQRGDIVLVKRAQGVSLGIIALNGRLIAAASAEGFLYLPLSLGLLAWRV